MTLRKKISKTQRLQKRREKLTKLKSKKEELRNRRNNLLQELRAKNRKSFEWIRKDKGGLTFKHRTGEIVETNQDQFFVDNDEKKWEQYKKLGEQENKTYERILETEKNIRASEKAVKKEKEKEEKSWEQEYFKNAVSYVRKNGVDRNLINRSINTYLRTMGGAMMAKTTRQGELKGFRGSWLKYNRGRVK